MASLDTFGAEAIFACYLAFRARRPSGIGDLRVFEDHANPEDPALWFIEDTGVVTAPLPSDYYPLAMSGLVSTHARDFAFSFIDLYAVIT